MELTILIHKNTLWSTKCELELKFMFVLTFARHIPRKDTVINTNENGINKLCQEDTYKAVSRLKSKKSVMN